MSVDRIAYFQNVKVWSRRMNVACDVSRAEKALGLLEKLNISETLFPLVCVFFCLQKDRGDKDLDLAIKISIVAARATIEILRGNHTSGTDSVAAFSKWVKEKTHLEDTWMKLLLTASSNRGVVNSIVADAIAARNEEKARPSLVNLIVADLHRQMAGQAH